MRKIIILMSLLVVFMLVSSVTIMAQQNPAQIDKSSQTEISPILVRLYQDMTAPLEIKEIPKEMVQENVMLIEEGNIIPLSAVPCFLGVTNELNIDQKNELYSLGVRLGEYLPFKKPVYTATIPISSLPQLRDLEYIQSVTPGYEQGILELPTTAREINATSVWNWGYNGSGVDVVVIDSSGVDANNPFIRDRIVNQYDYTDGDNIANPTGDHGTHCVGIIAANPINVETIGTMPEQAGITPGTSISNAYHNGTISENVDPQHQYDLNDDGDTLDSWNVLVADTVINGVYDAVYIDINNDGDWLDANEGPFNAFEWINMNPADIISPYSYYPVSQIKEDGTMFEFGAKGIAPGANVTVIKASNEADVTSAIRRAVDTYNADIISLSMGWRFTPHDGTGPMCDAVNYAVEHGAFFVKSAGNYQGINCHANGSVTNGMNQSFDLHTERPEPVQDPNTGLWYHYGTRVYLTWVNPPGQNNNLDLYIYDLAGNLVDSSTQIAGREEIVTRLDAGDYRVVVNGTSVAGSQPFHLYCDKDGSLWGQWYDQNFNPASPYNTLSDPGTANTSFTVGGVTKSIDAYGLTSYTSYGPTNNNVEKPDVVAPGGEWGPPVDIPTYSEVISTVRVNDANTTAGVHDPNDYYGRMSGTSMSAPHVAGAAALILEAVPALDRKPDILATAFEISAEDMGIVGWDRESGYGLIKVEGAREKVVDATILAGLQWLRNHQNPDGSWQNSVGITSMAALAFLNAGHTEDDPTVNKAIQYILNNRNADGSFGTRRTYETSLAVLALVATHNASYHDEIDDARAFLENIQWDSGEGIDESDARYGGFGYEVWSRPDLSNTQFALMALDAAYGELGLAKPSPDDVNGWPYKAIKFTSRCQNRPASNDQPWAHDTTRPSYNDGGFIYYGQSGGRSLAGGTKSYGSMTAAGIWSLRLCGVDVADPQGRVQAGLTWLTNNEDCSFDDNPGHPYGQGHCFLYYYYMTLAKAMVMCFEDDLICADWYANLSTKLADLQHDDGHWVNAPAAHGQEDIPELATDFALLALQTRQTPAANLWMSIILASNATLTVYDPQGRYARLGDITIPGATFEIDEEGRQIVNLTELEAGKYRIELKGTADGDYSLTVEGYRDGEQTSSETFEGTIEEGEYQKSDVLVTSMVGALTIYAEEPTPLLVTDLPNVELVSADPTVTSINVTSLNLSEVNETYKPEECITPQFAYMINSTGAGNFTLKFTDIPNANTIIVYKINATNQWIELDATTTADTVTFTMSVEDPPVVFCSGAPPAAARVPALTPIGIIALAGLLAIAAVSRIRKKK